MERKLRYVKGFTFYLDRQIIGSLGKKSTERSLNLLKEHTGIDTVVLAFAAWQETAHSDIIDLSDRRIPSDEELEKVISYAKDKLGLRVFLKPMINCKNGEWRAYINFFDREVPCESKWSVWFRYYESYLLHYADLAQKTGCELLFLGCELVMTERKESRWRGLIAKVRKRFGGLIAYNTDKYQEECVAWWDAVDVISSSGYYPINSWEQNLGRIRAVVEKFRKPFFFAECGCPCRKGASRLPNDWTYQGSLSLREQEEYYRDMFRSGKGCEWLGGYVGLSWNPEDIVLPVDNDSYSVYGKPACSVIRSFYTQKNVAR